MVERHALVLDDSRPLRLLLSRVLTAQGWAVDTSSRGEAGMALGLIRRPDVVLLDISEPDYAPEAVATGLRIHYGPALPILATAAMPHPELIQRIGAYDFLPKPLDMDRLFLLMNRGQWLTEESARLRARSNDALDNMRRLRIVPPPPGVS